jgi:hypothetical protein
MTRSRDTVRTRIANPGRDGYHAHALWCDCQSESRQHTWRIWFERYGRNRIEPVNRRDDVADYCAKYVCIRCVVEREAFESSPPAALNNNFAF